MSYFVLGIVILLIIDHGASVRGGSLPFILLQSILSSSFP